MFSFSLFLWQTVEILLHLTSKSLGTHTSNVRNVWNYWLICLKPDCLLILFWKVVQNFNCKLTFSYISWRYYFKYRTKWKNTKMWMNILPRKKTSFSSLNFVLGASRNPIPLCFYLSFSLEGFISSISRAIHTEISLSVITLLLLNIKFSRQTLRCFLWQAWESFSLLPFYHTLSSIYRLLFHVIGCGNRLMQSLAVHGVAVVSSPSDTEPTVDTQAFRAAQQVLSSSAPAPGSFCTGHKDLHSSTDQHGHQLRGSAGEDYGQKHMGTKTAL